MEAIVGKHLVWHSCLAAVRGLTFHLPAPEAQPLVKLHRASRGGCRHAQRRENICGAIEVLRYNP
jgi:hypothetical protein